MLNIEKYQNAKVKNFKKSKKYSKISKNNPKKLTWTPQLIL
jgi:hypothetical protein